MLLILATLPIPEKKELAPKFCPPRNVLSEIGYISNDVASITYS